MTGSPPLEKADGGLLRRVDRHLQRWVRMIIFELRRTQRVIVAPEALAADEMPIFLVGVHRSGTTLLRLIVDSHSRIACPTESFFVARLGELLDDAKSMEGLAAMGFPREQVVARLAETAGHFFRLYAAAKGKPRWADKTPSYVDCLDLLEALWGPRCRYLVIHRHGLDTACSLANTGIPEVDALAPECGGDRFVAGARYWARQTRKLLEFQARHAERCFEVRYEELTRDPEPLLRRMFAFLGEPFEPQVLRFHEQPHDVWLGLQDGKAARSRGFEPRIDVWREQPRPVVDAMLREAGDVLARLGYSTGPGA